jgi:opacity protein-like surface antigen
MRKIIAIGIILLSMLLSNSAFSYCSRVYTIFSESIAPLYKRYDPLLGIYIEGNLGYSWLSLEPYRSGDTGPLALGADHIKRSSYSFITALGYDFCPHNKKPIRLEINYYYADVHFTISPLFNGNASCFSDDHLLIRNAMASLYFDWHNCSFFVPYIGVNAGYANLKTHHHPNDTVSDQPLDFSANRTNFSWGATLGTRYFFSNYFFGNLQFRINNLGRSFYPDLTPETNAVFPHSSSFQADYLHEATIMLGLGYVF